MSYLDRLRTAKYTSPSGSEFAFKFNDLKRSSSKKAAVHELPQQDDPSVQDLGNTAVRFAIEAFFSGENYDQVADSFWDALAEKGPGVLQHPRWGDLSVLPLTYAQSEGFVDGMRQARFEIEFVRVGEIAYPTTIVQTEASIEDSLDTAGEATGEAFGAQFDPESAADTAAAKDTIGDSLAAFSENISGIIAENEKLSEEIKRLTAEIENTLDTLILDPIVMAQSYVHLFRTPGRMATSITKKIDGYGAMLKNLLGYTAPGSKPQA
ncbi:hypothetical protein LCGC14_2422150, partial [marine sediment metagenome]